MIKEFREKRVQKEDYGKIVRAGKLVATALYSTDSHAKKTIWLKVGVQPSNRLHR